MRTHKPTTLASNHELASQPGILSFDELKTMMAEVGLTGATPQERLMSLRGMDKADLALFTTAVNSRLNGTTETMIHEGTMKVGEQPTVAPEHRYDLYHAVVDQIQQAPTMSIQLAWETPWHS